MSGQIKNKSCWIIILLIVSICGLSHAQIIIKGNITDATGSPCPFVSVVLKELPDSVMVSYAFSNAEGKYQLKYSGKKARLNVSISGLTIVSQSKTIDNKDADINFKVQEKVVTLKEVVVKSTKIWGAHDTLNYLVSAFSNKNDVVIGDVLKKMPGIDVSESGQISYQGKPINKFYIENLDLLGGRYGIAINNIPVRDVATVQVLENHQPIKALQKLKSSDNAAINLKLKDAAKGIFTLVPRLGIGATPLLWDNELSGMYFAKKGQIITTYKGNNTGVDLSKELTSFNAQNSFNGNNLVGLQMPSPPSISQSRYLFNNSNAATINTLKKTGEDSQLNFNLIYYNDHENRRSTSQSSYYILKDSTIVVDEDMKSSTNTNRLETELRFNQNDSSKYVNDLVNVQGLWKDNLGDVITDATIHQQMKNPTFSVANSFYYIKKGQKENGYEISSLMGFKSSPQSLTIRPGLYSDLFNNDQYYAVLKQDARINHFYFDNSLRLYSTLSLWNVHIDPGFKTGLEYKNLRSDMYTSTDEGSFVQLPADSMKNNLDWSKYYGSLGISLRYNHNDVIKFDFSMPVTYNLLHINNRITNNSNTLQRLYFQPSFYASYQITAKIGLNADYSFYNQMGDVSTLYTGYILQSYRSLNHYDNRLAESQGNMGSVRLSYKDIINMFFLSGGISYNRSTRNILYGQTFKGILTLTSALENDNSSENVSVRGEISKGIDLMGIVASLNATYGKYSSEQLIQSRLVNYKSNSVNIAGSLNSRPLKWLYINYTGGLNRSWSKIEATESSPIRAFVNNVSADLSLSKTLSLNVNYEHYYNNAVPGNQNNSFTDLAMKYVWKDMHISLTWTNIFDTHSYATAYYSDLNSYRNVYEIRGTNILLKIMLQLNRKNDKAS
ncbi:MAG: carboxypeptidase-like regulatory domain-containing protein [Bacteroidota bacterium]|nr:carboxypeptidase-like regulatory domain-containing protein [Bacteroidota bacterium]